MDSSLPARSTALLLALVGALLVFRLGAVPLLGPDEPRYTRVAVEMHRAGEWVRPTLQGEPWLEKTPLFYWLASAGFSVLGETEAAARLPSVLATLLLVWVTAFVGARLFGTESGLHAAFVCGTAVLMFAYGHAASMDMLLAATVTAAIGLAGLRLLGRAGRWAIPVAAAFAGLATLAKGPLGLLLPGLVVFGFVLVTRQWRLLRELLSPLIASPGRGPGPGTGFTLHAYHPTGAGRLQQVFPDRGRIDNPSGQPHVFNRRLRWPGPAVGRPGGPVT